MGVLGVFPVKRGREYIRSCTVRKDNQITSTLGRSWVQSVFLPPETNTAPGTKLTKIGTQ